jgi:hypothetical protein
MLFLKRLLRSRRTDILPKQKHVNRPDIVRKICLLAKEAQNRAPEGTHPQVHKPIHALGDEEILALALYIGELEAVAKSKEIEKKTPPKW